MIYNWNLRGGIIEGAWPIMGSGVDATDAIDATDTAMVGETAAASTTDKPKWYILDLTETRVLPITLEISAIPTPSATSFRSCRSCSIDHSLPLKRNTNRLTKQEECP
jgi:hypothetical protein